MTMDHFSATCMRRLERTMSMLLVPRMIRMVVVLIQVIHAGYHVSAFQHRRPNSHGSPFRPHHDGRETCGASATEAVSRPSSPLAIRPVWSLPRNRRGAGGRFPVLFSSSSSPSTTMYEETMNRLGLQGEKFDRWRYLQKLLDDETDPVDTNRLVYGVLERYYNAKKTKSGNDGDNAEDDDIDTAPERTTERLLAIGQLLQDYAAQQSLDVISSSSSFSAEDKDSNNDASLVLSTDTSTTNMSNNVSLLPLALMEILPHPVNEEDDHKGTWDTVMELHGREGVRIEEQKAANNVAWKERCLAARILIYYDFLDYAPP